MAENLPAPLEATPTYETGARLPVEPAEAGFEAGAAALRRRWQAELGWRRALRGSGRVALGVAALGLLGLALGFWLDEPPATGLGWAALLMAAPLLLGQLLAALNAQEAVAARLLRLRAARFEGPHELALGGPQLMLIQGQRALRLPWQGFRRVLLAPDWLCLMGPRQALLIPREALSHSHFELLTDTARLHRLPLEAVDALARPLRTGLARRQGPGAAAR